MKRQLDRDLRHELDDRAFRFGGARAPLGPGPFAVLGPPFEPVLRGLGVLIVFWLILLWMYRRKIFVRT